MQSGVPVVYSPAYAIDIGLHVFPTVKFAAVRDALARVPVTDARLAYVEPAAATWDDLAKVHSPAYLAKLRVGDVTLADLAQLELPWSPAIVEGFRLMTGGTLMAARLALSARLAVHIGGGFHHAFPDHGEGFCMFNDVAVAIRVLQGEGLVARCAVVDCDVHHGNGTAATFAGDPSVLTLSLHQERNYPAVKPPSTVDVHLRDGTRDEEYLEHLRGVLPQVLDFAPDVVFYLAGADPYGDDQLGGLSLTQAGLRARDALVLNTFKDAGVSTVVTLAGGYARRVEDTIAIHVATIEQAVATFTRA